ncbi:MAG TPA: hypothetical protein VNY05_39465 [Candidatus Acidoferrales bacterium]|jgi:hypothetical protein|nr:hypothetical protein [Candidatus Acidoferrales bacterium]
MKWLQIVFPVALAGQLAIYAGAAERDPAQPQATAPVLRTSEPSDSVLLKLPGEPVPPKGVVVPAPAASVPAQGVETPAAPPMSTPVSTPLAPRDRRESPKSPAELETGTIAKTPKPARPPELAALPNLAPPELAKDSSLLCQKQIGHWKAADARSLMGAPLRQRFAYGDDKTTVNGRIYAFSDPTGRYRELELDFDKSTGNLRTVFSYPPRMTWKECLRLWGNKVAATDARQGRTFYSYLDRRLDVLVDQAGNVISLGLY